MEKGSDPPPYSASYPQAMPMPTQVQMVPTVINYGPDPQRCICPSCHADILTKVETESTSRTHLMAFLLCMFLCVPCVCVPYCVDSCQNRNHYCPNCSAYLGKYDS